jgi:uncharacterized Zn finger protein
MIELKSREQLASAIERARRDAKSLVVRATGASRRYLVTNRERGTQYTVEFFVRGGRRFGHCNCKAGTNNIACKHLVAAAALNIYFATQGLLDAARRRAA